MIANAYTSKTGYNLPAFKGSMAHIKKCLTMHPADAASKCLERVRE